MKNFKLKRYRDFDSEVRLKIRQLIPSALVDQLSLSLLGTINMMMVSSVGDAAVAGVGQVDTVNFIVSMVFNSLAVGGTVIVAQCAGRKDLDATNDAAAQAVFFGALLNCAVVLGIFALRGQMLGLLYGSVEAEVMQNSLNYITWSLLSLIPAYLISQCGGILRAAGDPGSPMLANIFINVVNIALGYVLIIGLGPNNGYGSTGAGVTLFTARAIGAGYLLFKITRRGAVVRIGGVSGFRFRKAVIRPMLAIGLPASMEQFLFQSGRLAAQVIVSTMGTVMISGNQIGFSIYMFVLVPMMSLQIVATTAVGYFTGEGSRNKAKEALSASSHLCSACGIMGFAILLLIPGPLVSLYTKDPEITALTVNLLRMISIGFLSWSQSFLLAWGFRGTGDVRFTLTVGVISVLGPQGRPVLAAWHCLPDGHLRSLRRDACRLVHAGHLL